jgi:hypothetical protein
MENEMKMTKDAHETWNKMVSNIRHSMVGKIDKEIKHDNMIKWQGKMTKYT